MPNNIIIVHTIPRNATIAQHKLYPHKNECNDYQKGIKCPTLPTHSSIDQNLHIMYRIKASRLNGSMVRLSFKIRNLYSLCSNESLPCFHDSPGFIIHNQVMGARNYISRKYTLPLDQIVTHIRP
jgi:hypothetical protein